MPRKSIRSLCLAAVISCLAAGWLVSAEQCPAGSGELKRAMSLAREGRYEESIVQIKAVLERQPESDNTRAHLSLGLVYFKAKDYANSLAEFERTIALKAESPMAYYFKGLIYEHQALAVQNQAEARALKVQARDSWTKYLELAGTQKKLSAAHAACGISLPESKSRAQKHLNVLQEELSHE